MSEFNLTGNQPARVTVAQAQPLDQALDVSGYSGIDALAALVSAEGTISTDIQIEIITGMQKNTEDGWVVCCAPSTWAHPERTPSSLRAQPRVSSASCAGGSSPWVAPAPSASV